MKNSCGAILYAFDKDGRIGIILGSEGYEEWLPFKGCNEEGETFEQTAIREIREETCGLVSLDSISLDHVFTTKHKIYRIGLCRVDFDIIEQFEKVRKAESRKEFREKQEIRFFPLDTIFIKQKVHSISRASIKFYWDKLATLAGKQLISPECVRCHGMTEEQAKCIKDKALTEIGVTSSGIITTKITCDTSSDMDDMIADLLKLDLNTVDGNKADESSTNTPISRSSSNSSPKPDQPSDKDHTSDKDRTDNQDQELPKYKKPKASSMCTTYTKKHDLATFLSKRNTKSSYHRKSAVDFRGRGKREYNLSRPRKIGIYYTPAAERMSEESKTWR